MIIMVIIIVHIMNIIDNSWIISATYTLIIGVLVAMILTPIHTINEREFNNE
jgi:hypothetical protein